MGACGAHGGQGVRQDWSQQNVQCGPDKNSPVPAPAPAPAPSAEETNDIWEGQASVGQVQETSRPAGVNADDKALLDAINEARRQRGLPPLKMSENLCRGAEANNDANIATGTLGHHHDLGADGADGEITAGAAGSSMTPEEAVQLWINSPGHAAIMFDPNQQYFGGNMKDGFATARFV